MKISEIRRLMPDPGSIAWTDFSSFTQPLTLKEQTMSVGISAGNTCEPKKQPEVSRLLNELSMEIERLDSYLKTLYEKIDVALVPPSPCMATAKQSSDPSESASELVCILRARIRDIAGLTCQVLEVTDRCQL